MRTCSRCGTVADGAEELPAGWSFEIADGSVAWLCLRCTRDNVRAIEAKLPEEWWT